jgi:hypothetical protein
MFGRGKARSRIFINYRRSDSAGFAGRLSDTLGEYFGDDRVFRDIDGIEGGADFEDVLKQTAQAADAMIVLIGPDWVTMTNQSGQRRLHDPDDWVAREIAAAIEKRIPVFPVLIESAPMPRAEELPESLKPLVRYNAISISDSRWSSDVNRLAKIVAIDIPGSAAERILHWVRLAISIALFAAISFTTGVVALKVAAKIAKELQPRLLDVWRLVDWLWSIDPGPLKLWQSGVTFVVIVGSSMLLLVFAHLVDESKRGYVYAASLVGLLGSCACFIWLEPLNDAMEPIAMFFGSTVTATAVLILMNLSGFKAK